MAKFTTGLLLGALAGTAYGLLTAKRTGHERQQAAATYVNDLATSTQAVQQSLQRLRHATTAVKAELTNTLKPNVDAINAAVTDYQFQTEGNREALAAHLDTINAATDQLGKVTPEV